MIGEAEAIEAARIEQMRATHPELRVTTWFGDFESDAPLPSPKRSLLVRRRYIAPNTKVPVWLVKFWNFQRRMVGRGGAQATITKQYAVVDAKTGFVMKRFGER